MGVVSNSAMIFPLEFEDACDIAPLEDHFDQHLHKEEEEVRDQDQEKEKQVNKYEILVSNLEVKLPSLGGEIRIQDKAEDDDDGLKTPTSLDHKIPSPILTCPLPPRKPRSTPSTKRKSSHLTAVLDLSNEIESLFPPAHLADLGVKIKKVRQGIDAK